MGNLNNFHINDDGSVTVEQQLSEQEKNILDIMKIEKSKGGIFASRRMKKRAIKYAKSVNYPEFKVDKLMLDGYPVDFANYPRTNSLIVWTIIAIVFISGALLFTYPTYTEFRDASQFNNVSHRNHALWFGFISLLGLAARLTASTFFIQKCRSVSK